MRATGSARSFAHAGCSLALALALAGVGCASDEVDKTRPLGDDEKAAIEDRAETDQDDLEENIDKERDR